jgi:pimeloyl-ACP methyl ester carboxylesterase
MSAAQMSASAALPKPDYSIYGNGAPILYLCGIEGTGRLFYKQIDDLGRDHTVLLMPLRARGRYAMTQLVADARFVIRDAGFENATVLGESFGGMIALALARAHPELVARMILVNTFPYFKDRAKINLGVALFSLFPALLKLYRRRDSHHTVCAEDVAEADRLKYGELTADVCAAGREGYISRLRIIRDTDLRGDLHQIKTPTLVVAGTCDRFLDSASAARLIAAEMPRAKLKLLEGIGHTPLLVEGVRVREWLAEVDQI